MQFVPAGELIGNAHQVRTVGLRDSPKLPDGDYRFVDTYCTDPSCDCRKTMILVFRNDVHVSTINVGWESADFYQRWMGGAKDAEDTGVSMSGVSADASPPQSRGAAAQVLLPAVVRTCRKVSGLTLTLPVKG